MSANNQSVNEKGLTKRERDERHIDGHTWTMLGILLFMPTVWLVQLILILVFG